MLVLSRKPGEVIVVPQRELTITVVSVEGKNARLGMCTPDEIDVYRNEVWQSISKAPDRPPAKS
jgi:carbon storage regulator